MAGSRCFFGADGRVGSQKFSSSSLVTVGLGGPARVLHDADPVDGPDEHGDEPGVVGGRVIGATFQMSCVS